MRIHLVVLGFFLSFGNAVGGSIECETSLSPDDVPDFERVQPLATLADLDNLSAPMHLWSPFALDSNEQRLYWVGGPSRMQVRSVGMNQLGKRHDGVFGREGPIDEFSATPPFGGGFSKILWTEGASSLRAGLWGSHFVGDHPSERVMILRQVFRRDNRERSQRLRVFKLGSNVVDFDIGVGEAPIAVLHWGRWDAAAPVAAVRIFNIKSKRWKHFSIERDVFGELNLEEDLPKQIVQVGPGEGVNVVLSGEGWVVGAHLKVRNRRNRLESLYQMDLSGAEVTIGVDRGRRILYVGRGRQIRAYDVNTGRFLKEVYYSKEERGVAIRRLLVLPDGGLLWTESRENTEPVIRLRPVKIETSS